MKLRLGLALTALVPLFSMSSAHADSASPPSPSTQRPGDPPADDDDSSPPPEAPPPAAAPPATAAQIKAMEAELDLLKLRLQILEAPKPRVRRPATPANVFNPRITAFIDLVGSLGINSERVDPGFDVRSFELDIRSDIDPFAKAVVVLSFANPLNKALEDLNQHHEPTALEVAEAWASSIEEANVTFVALPAHLLVETGIVRVDFSNLNRLHLHDTPHTDLPRAMTALLGDEGWGDAGIFLRYRLHNPKSLPIDFKIGATARGPEPLMVGRKTATPILLARFQASGDFGAGSLLSGGASYAGWRDATRELRGFNLAAADFLLKIRPPHRGQYRSFFLQGEAYFANRFGAGGRNSLAGWLGMGIQPANNVFISLRGDALVEDLANPEVKWGAGVAASLYTTEFLRIRLAYDLLSGDLLAHRVGVQLTAVFGSHPVEPYWVNR